VDIAASLKETGTAGFDRYSVLSWIPENGAGRNKFLKITPLSPE
jgi:hypothetical protein